MSRCARPLDFYSAACLFIPVIERMNPDGKNHFGDRNMFLPTVHGFDEFYGNLYHLNAEEEPEDPDYPRQPMFRQLFGPRGVLHCRATDVDDPTDDPRFGRVGKQSIEDTGPLNKEMPRKKTLLASS